MNGYTLRARLSPVLITALPGTLAAVAWIPDLGSSWSAVWAIVAASGLPGFAAQLGRDRGKLKESELFEQWGGKPTTRMLRHAGPQNRVTLARCHTRLEELMETTLPTAADEAADPGTADDLYEACATFLKSRTRDKAAFPVIYEENVGYGFRRNLWGLKPIGILVCLGSIAAVASLVGIDLRHQVGTSPLTIVVGAIDIFALLSWIFVVTPAWVRLPAEEYARQLLSACEAL